MSEVMFTCPTLTVERSGLVSEMLIPDARRALPENAHPDGTPATPHFAGWSLYRDGSSAEYFQADLTGHTIEISDGSGDACVVDGSLDAIPDLSYMVNAESPDPIRVRTPDELTGLLAAAIQFKGGALGTVTGSISGVEYSYPNAFSATEAPEGGMAAYVRWAPTEGRPVTVTIAESNGNDSVTLNLKGNDRLIIYNWDSPRPTLAELSQRSRVVRVDGESATVDRDFKWIYEMLIPESGDWKGWLERAKDKQLPAPEIRWTPTTQAAVDAINAAVDGRTEEEPEITNLGETTDTSSCGCSRFKVP